MPVRSVVLETCLLDPIGAELRGADLGEGLDDALFGELKAALLEHGLVLLRNQTLTDEQQLALGRRFGPLEGEEFMVGREEPSLLVISNVRPDGTVAPAKTGQMRSISINEVWHTDSSFRETPAAVSIFRALEVAPEGGDTLFASLRLGWEELEPARREALHGLRAVHDYGAAYDRAGGRLPDEARALMTPKTHPMLRVHPETEKTGLYVSGHASHVEGMPSDEGRKLLEELVAWCTRPGRVYRHRWQVGDLVLWDNRCMLHRAQGFDEQHRRVMHHVRVAGDGPVVEPSLR